MDIISLAGKAMLGIDRMKSKSYAKKHPFTAPEKKPAIKLSADRYICGFAKAEMMPQDLSERDYMMAGFAPGLKCEGIHDPMTIRAMWIGLGEKQGILWITADCIGVSGPEVEQIRTRLQAFCKETGCVAINFSSSHTHGGLDTCGYWGKLPKTGMVPSYMEHIYNTAVEVSKQAYEARKPGKLFSGRAHVENGVYRRRYPIVTRDVLTRIRFAPDDGSRETWLLNFNAHPNTLGKENRKVSADYPYFMREKIYESKDVNVMFTVGAIGAADIGNFDENDKWNRAKLGGEAVGTAALTIEDSELECKAKLVCRTMLFPDDNDTLTFLSLIGVVHAAKQPYADSQTGFALEAETTYIELGEQKILCLSGELFCELAYGGYSTAEESATGKGAEINPTPLVDIVGDKNLIICGVTNGMTGYIIAPNDFIRRPDECCLSDTKDRFDRGHYHETNSISVRCAGIVADTLKEMYNA